MHWSTTNDSIVTASLDGTCRMWQISNGKCIRILKDNYGAQVLCCCFHTINENMIFTGNSKGIIQVYNSSTGLIVNKNCLQKVVSGGQVNCICFDSTGQSVWVGDNKGTIQSFQFNMFTLKLTKTRKIIQNAGYSITSISYRNWQNNSPTLLINAMPNYLLLYRIIINNTNPTINGTLKLRKRICIQQANTQIRSSYCPLLTKKNINKNVCFVCSGSEDGCVYFYDMENDENPLLNKLQGHSSTVKDVAFNYDQSFLASGDVNGSIIIWKTSE
jgi:WD repeat-containing protein 13